MRFSWKCKPADFARMGSTARLGVGLSKPKVGETYGDVALKAIRDGIGSTVARYLYHNVPPRKDLRILDFGCGPLAIQVRGLDKAGYNIVGFEWEPNITDKSNRASQYWMSLEEGFITNDLDEVNPDIVIASNVMNVQPTWGCFWTTMNNLASLLDYDTEFICNLSREPRHLWSRGRKGDLELESMLAVSFWNVDRKENSVPGTRDYIWSCSRWSELTDEDQRDITIQFLDDGILEYRGGLL